MRRILRYAAPCGVLLLAVSVVLSPSSYLDNVLAAASFLETFDGTPPTPQDYANPHNWDIFVQGFNQHEADAGSNIAQHGPACDGPGFPYTSNNSHPLHSQADAVFLCNGHLMTSLGLTGYGAVYMTPPAVMDLSGGRAVLKWDMSTLRTAARDWVDIVINPYSEHQQLAYNNNDQHVPPDNIHIQLAGGGNVFLVTERVAGGADVPVPGDIFTSWDMVQAAQSPPLGEDAARRDTFEVELSPSHVRVCIVGNNTGQTYTFRGSAFFCWVDTDLPTPLSPAVWSNQASIQLAHRDYNPEKSCTDIEDSLGVNHTPLADITCPPDTWHWDNVSINPAIPFSIIKPTQEYDLTDPSPQVVTFQEPAPANTNLEFVTFGGNSALQVSYDGGRSWHHPNFQPATAPGHDENGEMVWDPVPPGTRSVVVQGQNGFWGTYSSTAFNLVSATAGVVIPTLTPTPVGGGIGQPTATPTPRPGAPSATSTPTATNTPPPTATSTATATPTAQRAGSLAFDGQSGYADVPGDAANLHLTGDWSVETWFKDDDPAGFDHLYRALIDDGDGVTEAPYHLLIGNGNLLAGVQSGGTNFSLAFSMDQAGVDPHQWHHAAATFRANGRMLTLYLDGQRVAQQVNGGTLPVHAPFPLQLGRFGPTTGKLWQGKLADVRIWNVVRTPGQVQSGFAKPLSGVQPGLVANWRMFSGAPTADSVSAANNAVLHGGAAFSTDSPFN